MSLSLALGILWGIGAILAFLIYLPWLLEEYRAIGHRLGAMVLIDVLVALTGSIFLSWIAVILTGQMYWRLRALSKRL